MTDRISFGKWGEEYALRRLQEGGFLLVEKNARAGRWGEIDLVMIDKREREAVLVFVEVKTRRSGTHGGPLGAITPHKVRTLKRAGQFYKIKNPNTPEGMRIDVVAIIASPNAEKCLSFEHFENVG